MKFRGILALFMSTIILGVTGCSAVSGQVGKNQTNATKKEQAADKGNRNKEQNKGEPIVIRLGTHAIVEDNPHYKDPITSVYTMEESERSVRLEALANVEEELNVKIEFVEYPGDVTEVLLQSVLAGDPICDVARIYTNGQGTILGQNVLQPIDDYVELLGDKPMPSFYGHHYFIESASEGHPLSPLVYNIGYIEEVDALKVDGQTVYPTDLYKEGKWTWNTFKDYIAKIDAYYMNSQAPERPEQRIEAFWTDYTEVLIQALHANGSSIYGEDGLELLEPKTIEAVSYVTDLVRNNLLKTTLAQEGDSARIYNDQGKAFYRGETVFSNVEGWRLGGYTGKFAERGHSIGVIPFPRPDHMEPEDPNYGLSCTPSESFGVVKGLDQDKVPLAIEGMRMYWSEIARIREEKLGISKTASALDQRYDIFHPKIGEDMMEIYNSMATPVSELGLTVGVYWPFMRIAGDVIYGVNGASSYEITMGSRANEVTDAIEAMETLLGTDEVRDNIPPKFTHIEDGRIAYPIGTDIGRIDWATHFAVVDNIDGPLEISRATIEYSKVNESKAGIYGAGLVLSMTDSLENKATSKADIVIYDANNTDAPILEAKAQYRQIKIGEDPSRINWRAFVEIVKDVDGIDLKDRIQADLSELDTTTAGTYTVVLSVMDYAGNTTTVDLPVTVASK